MKSQTLFSGQTIRVPVLTGHSVLVSPRSGQFSAAVVAGVAGMPVSLASGSSTVSTFGPWATGVEVRITAAVGAVIDFDVDPVPTIERGDLGDFGVGVGPGGTVVGPNGQPVAGLIVQAVRTASFTLLPSDSGSVIPVTGNVTVTADASSSLTAPVEVRRMNAGTLGGVGSGVTLWDSKTPGAWGTFQVAGEGQSLVFDPIAATGKMLAYKVGV